MADDFLLSNAEKRLQGIRAAKQRCMANLAEYQASECDDAAQEELGALAHLEVEERGIHQMRQDYLRAQNPAPQPQTPEELRVKPAEKMTWSDGLEVAVGNSKYGKGVDFNDPNVQRGYAEVQRRRGRGE